MYLIAACSLTLRPLLAKIPFTSLKTSIGYGRNTKMTTNTKGSVKDGFIQMEDFHQYEHSQSKSKIPASRSFKVDVEPDVELAEPARFYNGHRARSNY